MIKAEDLKGKTIEDIITPKTKMLGKFYGPEGFETIIKWVGIQGFVKEPAKAYSVAYYNDYVMCFRNDDLIALFEVYELRNCILNEQHGLLIAVGNGVLKQYWFDDEEYIEEVW